MPIDTSGPFFRDDGLQKSKHSGFNITTSRFFVRMLRTKKMTRCNIIIHCAHWDKSSKMSPQQFRHIKLQYEKILRILFLKSSLISSIACMVHIKIFYSVIFQHFSIFENGWGAFWNFFPVCCGEVGKPFRSNCC